LVDEDLLREFNRSGYVTIATVPNFSYAAAGQRVATVKTAPFAIPEEKFRAALALARERGPVLQARPIRNPAVGVLYSDPRQAQRGRALFEGIMRTRLERLGTAAAYVLATLEEEERLARSLEHMLRARPSLVLIASTTAPAGPDDVVGRAIARVGCRLECFLAPVEPGNLLLLSYAGKVPVVSAPGCFRSPKPNVVDLVLPPLLAWYPLTAVEISELGHGGLLQ
jgi:molybdenum cofactor cytidylyltransferase